MCKVEGCGRKKAGKGYCGAHYYQLWRYGDALRADKNRAARPSQCTVVGCTDTKKLARGMCHKHYEKWRKYGDPTIVIQNQTRGTLWERIAQSIDVTPYCWNWVLHTNKGYGQICVNGKQVSGHRLVYEIYNGEIPEGLEIDHKCHNPGCVNPQHLRAVTSGENSQNFKGARADSTTGFRGVYYLNRTGTYVAKAVYKGVQYTNGSRHKTVEEANRAAIELRKRLYTHNEVDRLA